MRLGTCIGIKIFKVLFPRAEQFPRCSLLNAVFHFLAILILRIAFIIEVVETILVYDVVVYATILGRKELLGFTLECSEV